MDFLFEKLIFFTGIETMIVLWFEDLITEFDNVIFGIREANTSLSTIAGELVCISFIFALVILQLFQLLLCCPASFVSTSAPLFTLHDHHRLV